LSSAAIASRAARSGWRRSAPLERYWRSQPVWVLVAATLLVRAWRPELLPGRCRTDAAFAMLGGAAPIPASSGQTVRVRLNRSGDRQLNQALYTVVLTRLRTDPATRAYATRRRAQGKTNREIKRCLIRYVARQLYRVLETQPALDPTEERPPKQAIRAGVLKAARRPGCTPTRPEGACRIKRRG